MNMGDILDRIEGAAIHHVRAPVVEARHDLEHVPELARREHALRGKEIGVETSGTAAQVSWVIRRA
ncbi:hypothetical protein [Enorma phocaeensis]|uniref:hypothetical protein n=1 Tax=Enorma phocaeensis TaxID=1871019 RepID=UPI001CA4818E|nr:hypothetical protein [Enorma phocaeensis]